MKIAHLCLSCFYIDGYSYQENELVAQNIADGHEVLVIASTETYGADRKLTYCAPAEYIGTDGAKVIRLPYRKWLPHKLMRKLRMHPGVYPILKDFSPDIILFHGLCGWELNTAAKYVNNHPKVRLYADCHEDFNNSARTFISKYFLHLAYYRSIIKNTAARIHKVFCVSIDSINFATSLYKLPLSSVEFYPLGGKIFRNEEYSDIRIATRLLIGVDEATTVFIQSGKIDGTKKINEALSAFTKTKNPNFKFLVVGNLDESVVDSVERYLDQDSRITFLGWKTADELRNLLCAADIYVQPGTQSATMQMSICCRCAVLLDDVPSHRPFIEGNGWLISKEQNLDSIFKTVEGTVHELPSMAINSARIAAKLLDYKLLAARLYK